MLGNIYLCAVFRNQGLFRTKQKGKHEEKNDFSGCGGYHGYGLEGVGQSGVAKWGRVECEDCAEQ